MPVPSADIGTVDVETMQNEETVQNEVGVIDLAALYPQLLGVSKEDEAVLFDALQSVLRRDLPEGWSLQGDEERGASYFWNEQTGESLWTHPYHESFAWVVEVYRRSGEEELDPQNFIREEWTKMEAKNTEENAAWSEAYKTEDGLHQYWHNSLTQRSIWQDPLLEAQKHKEVRSTMISDLLANAETRPRKMQKSDRHGVKALDEIPEETDADPLSPWSGSATPLILSPMHDASSTISTTAPSSQRSELNRNRLLLPTPKRPRGSVTPTSSKPPQPHRQLLPTPSAAKRSQEPSAEHSEVLQIYPPTLPQEKKPRLSRPCTAENLSSDCKLEQPEQPEQPEQLDQLEPQSHELSFCSETAISSAESIQRCWRRVVESRKLRKKGKALLHKLRKKRDAELEDQRSAAAILAAREIQGCWRSYRKRLQLRKEGVELLKAKKLAKEKEMLEAKMARSVLRIQKAWRSFRLRKEQKNKRKRQNRSRALPELEMAWSSPTAASSSSRTALGPISARSRKGELTSQEVVVPCKAKDWSSCLDEVLHDFMSEVSPKAAASKPNQRRNRNITPLDSGNMDLTEKNVPIGKTPVGMKMEEKLKKQRLHQPSLEAGLASFSAGPTARSPEKEMLLRKQLIAEEKEKLLRKQDSPPLDWFARQGSLSSFSGKENPLQRKPFESSPPSQMPSGPGFGGLSPAMRRQRSGQMASAESAWGQALDQLPSVPSLRTGFVERVRSMSSSNSAPSLVLESPPRSPLRSGGHQKDLAPLRRAGHQLASSFSRMPSMPVIA